MARNWRSPRDRRDEIDLVCRDGDVLVVCEVKTRSSNRYGTPRGAVESTLHAGRDVLFDIDWQGAAQIQSRQPQDVVKVFILPPSMADLARRLHARAQDSEAVIQHRLERASDEIARWGDYDYVIVNKSFDRAYADLGHIYRAERMKPGRNPWLPGFVGDLLGE